MLFHSMLCSTKPGKCCCFCSFHITTHQPAAIHHSPLPFPLVSLRKLKWKKNKIKHHLVPMNMIRSWAISSAYAGTVPSSTADHLFLLYGFSPIWSVSKLFILFILLLCLRSRTFFMLTTVQNQTKPVPALGTNTC